MTDTAPDWKAQRDSRIARRRMKSPLGIILFGVLHVLVGLVLFSSLFMLTGQPERPQGAIPDTQRSTILPIVELCIPATIALLSGVGLFSQTRWGWWLSTFWYVYNVCRAAVALLAILTAGRDSLSNPVEWTRSLAWCSGGLLYCIVVLPFFFRADVRTYFGVPSIDWRFITGVNLAIAIVVITAASTTPWPAF